MGGTPNSMSRVMFSIDYDRVVDHEPKVEDGESHQRQDDWPRCSRPGYSTPKVAD